MPEIEFEALADSQIKVLVADDDAMFRLILKNWLEDWGFCVLVAEDGAQAWEILQQNDPPELLILDWVMPKITGIELCRMIRQRHQDLYQYIMLATGKDDKQHVVKGFDAGADDYLTKPFVQNELRARLRVGKRILSLQKNLIHAREELRYQATHDVLTGLLNRRALLEIFDNELDRAVRTPCPTGVLMLDLDHFKHINDTYGHLVGDLVLKETVRRINLSIRSYDIAGRFGGEEFLIVLPDCSLEQTRLSAERIRKAIGESPICMGAESISMTTSIGATVAEPGISTKHEILAAADNALYLAKQSGRNCTVVLKAAANMQICN
jgi:two-component system, cell cycle response regulator